VALLDLTQHPDILLMPGIVNSAFDANQAVNNSIHKPPAGENLKGSTVTARVYFMMQT
jgi:hypothetical protein